MTYRLTQKAEEDVIEIFMTGAQLFGVDSARVFQQRLASAFSRIAAFPRLGPERTEFDPPVRTYPVGSHVVIYRAFETGSILIVRVRHQREDWLSEDMGEMV